MTPPNRLQKDNKARRHLGTSSVTLACWKGILLVGETEAIWEYGTEWDSVFFIY